MQNQCVLFISFIHVLLYDIMHITEIHKIEIVQVYRDSYKHSYFVSIPQLLSLDIPWGKCSKRVLGKF